MTIDFVLDLPSKDAPGYLRRQRTAIRLMRRFKELADKPDEGIVDDMISFLAPFVTEPKDPDVVADLLLDFSEDQFNELLEGVIGKAGEAIDQDIPPTKGKS